MIQAAETTDPRDAPAVIHDRGRTATPLLSVNDLQVEFVGRGRTVRAVRGLSYDIGPGETIGLVGESGSGKSVSALSLLGLLPKRVGRVAGGTAVFGGKDLLTMLRGRAAQDPGCPDRDDLPGPLVQPEPGVVDRPPDHRGDRDAQGHEHQVKRRSGPSSSSIWSASRARPPGSTTIPTSSAAGCASAR